MARLLSLREMERELSRLGAVRAYLTKWLGEQIVGQGDFAHKVGREGVKYAKKLTGKPGPPRSKAGKPPKKDTGALMHSFKYDVDKHGRRHTVRLYNVAKNRGVAYPVVLELGRKRTQLASYMAPRPHMEKIAKHMAKVARKQPLKRLAATLTPKKWHVRTEIKLVF